MLYRKHKHREASLLSSAYSLKMAVVTREKTKGTKRSKRGKKRAHKRGKQARINVK